jgi:hypothetical protein
MSKTKFSDKIKETASILKSIYTIVLIASIAIAAFIQIVPWFFQPWVIEVVRIITPILAAVFISYILIVRMKNHFYEEIHLSNTYYAAHAQALHFALSVILIQAGKLEDFQHLIGAIKKMMICGF